MALSWNEIKDRALKFSREWADTTNEDADAKPFLEAFFNVFGISRKKVATFEYRVKKLDEHDGYIDLLWKGTMLVEMKSRGKDLAKAYQQAIEYLQKLPQHELPRYILISDFELFRLYDLEEDSLTEFKFSEFVNNVQHFGFIAGYQGHIFKEQDPVNIKAAELMGKLHDKLKAVGYDGHSLEVYLVRLLFCLFADDTTIFEKDIFNDFIEQRTNEDGSDLAPHISELFFILNTPQENRLKNLDEQLTAFPFVNGKLFEEVLPHASFDRGMRLILLECCNLDWSKISPAIFGSMFQSVKNPIERRNLGAHYTSEKNILKLIKPLFLDELWSEFETVKDNKTKLIEFHKKISNLKFLDPACGCGNFLVVTYRELRLLEIEILRVLYKSGQGFLNVKEIIWLDVDMMYGIECEEFPARIAEVAMWLIDHQMNMVISNEFGQYFVRLPLKKAATIVHGDALKTDWQSLLNPVNTKDVYAKHTNIFLVEEPKEKYNTVNVQTETFKIHRGEQPPVKEEIKFDYIFGNPPFIGKQMQNDGGNFLFTDDEKKALLKIEPNAKKFIKPLVSAHEFLNGKNRWCLWLKDAEPGELRELKEVTKRIAAVKKLREESSRETTKKLASFPTLFGEIRQPVSKYILIPRHSSENRKYIPIGFFSHNVIVSDSCLAIDEATLFHFGVLQSEMHMAWVGHVCGRLEISFRYSNEIVYNNFPWPEKPNAKQIIAIETAAQKVLDVRAKFPESSLAELYDPLSMPPILVKAHNDLDKAVDLAYRSQPFATEAKRMEFLFELYEKYTQPLDFAGKKKVKRTTKT